MSDTRQDAGASRSPARQLSDEELDAYILTRLEALGVDLDVLPEDDPEAPADRRRILRSARRFLRETLPALAGFEMELDDAPPLLYPAGLRSRTDDEER